MDSILMDHDLLATNTDSLRSKNAGKILFQSQ
jgi:hypothetical protein